MSPSFIFNVSRKNLMSCLRSLTNLSMGMIDLRAIVLISSESYLQSLALLMKSGLWRMGNMEPRMMPMDSGMEWFVN
jgi:hypothetical protein